VILLTRNERRAAVEDPAWRLAVVTQALTDPQLRIVEGPEALGRSTPFIYQVDLG